MRLVAAIALILSTQFQSFCQGNFTLEIDKNFKSTFPQAVVIDSSEKDLLKYICRSSTAAYNLITMDSFEVESKKDMNLRLNGLLDAYKERLLFPSHSERRSDTIIGGAYGMYMVFIDTSGKSPYSKCQLFYTVMDKRLYGLQVILSTTDPITLSEANTFFSNLYFSGEPYYKYGKNSTVLTRMLWFLVIIVLCGFLMKSIIERKQSLY